jgi:hypothetical protein
MVQSKSSPRSAVFQEQLKKMEEKHKQDLLVLDEMQDFFKSRARLETEFATGLQKLAQHFLAKRKWPPFSCVAWLGLFFLFFFFFLFVCLF